MGTTGAPYDLPWPDPAVDPVRGGAAAMEALAEKVHERMGKTRLDLLVQSGTTVLTTNAGGDANVNFPVPYASPPMVVACSGDDTLATTVTPWTITTANTAVRIRHMDGSVLIGGLTRVNWVAQGTPA